MNRIKRKDWEEHGVLILACFVLFGSLLFRFNDDYRASPRAYPDLASVFLLPISVFFSARTAICFASRFAPAVGWWLHGLLRWTFYGAAHMVVTSIVVGMIVTITPLRGIVDAVAPSASSSLFRALMFGIPAFLMVRQITQDYAGARRHFGSLAQAERTLHSTAALHSRGCRP